MNDYMNKAKEIRIMRDFIDDVESIKMECMLYGYTEEDLQNTAFYQTKLNELLNNPKYDYIAQMMNNNNVKWE